MRALGEDENEEIDGHKAAGVGRQRSGGTVVGTTSMRRNTIRRVSEVLGIEHKGLQQDRSRAASVGVRRGKGIG